MSPPRAELTYRTSIRAANAAGDARGGWILKLLDDAMVALDDEGVPMEVPRLEVDGPEASRRRREAQLRRDIRLVAPPNLHQLHAALHAGRTDRSLVP
jgi:acyl-CoA hydrolase